MTDKQPKALLLANILEHQIPSIACLEVSALELRRLHEVNAELLEALKMCIDNPWREGTTQYDEVIQNCKAVLAKAEVTK
jgi:hypothetical protein